MKSLKCKSCKKKIDMDNTETKKRINAKLKNKTYKMSNKTEKRYLKLVSQCYKCKNAKPKKCKIDDYIAFSGAEVGKCKE